jgi:hypothetical protein
MVKAMCFLIGHCIWDEVGQRELVERFVKEVVQKHGYKTEIPISSILSEIEAYKKDVEKQTRIPKRTEAFVNKIHVIKGQEYYAIKNISGHLNYENNRFILKTDFESANANEFIQRTRYKSDLSDKDPITFKRGQENVKIIIKDQYNRDKELEMESQVQVSNEMITFKPHEAILREWDLVGERILSAISNVKQQLEEFTQKVSKYLRMNVFVDAGNAMIVESNLTETKLGLEKLELDVISVQQQYQNIEGGSLISTPNKVAATKPLSPRRKLAK